MFSAGKAAIAKATTMEKLTAVTERMEARKGDLSPEQFNSLMELALAKEQELAPAQATSVDDDPFGDD